MAARRFSHTIFRDFSAVALLLPSENQIFACLLRRLKINFYKYIFKLLSCPHPVDRVLSVTFTFPSHVILYFPFSLRYAILKYDSRELSGIIWWKISFFWRFEKLHFMCKYVLYIKTWPRGSPRTHLSEHTSLCRAFKLSITR